MWLHNGFVAPRVISDGSLPEKEQVVSFGELASSGPQGISSSFDDLTARPEPTTLRPSDPHATSLHQCLGARLRLARKRAGLSQTAMGQLLDVSLQQYGKYETGENRISLPPCIGSLHVSASAPSSFMQKGSRRWARMPLSRADGTRSGHAARL